MRWAVKGGGGAAAICLAALAVAPAADAHDWLVSSNPAANATVTQAPTDVALTFNEPVLTKPAAPRVAVLGPDGKHYETGCPSALDATVQLPWKAGAPGRYTVEWRIISADGHPVSDSISFTYSGAAGSNKGSDAAPRCDGAQGDSSTTSSSAGAPASGASGGSSAAAAQGPAASSASEASSGDAAPVYVVGGVALAAVAAVGVMVVRSRRHPDEMDDEEASNHRARGRVAENDQPSGDDGEHLA